MDVKEMEEGEEIEMESISLPVPTTTMPTYLQASR
jgi:hypothetical protein